MAENATNTGEQAGKGGVVPPKDKRFGQPGGNPINIGGRPKGSPSISRAMARALARNPDEDGIGQAAGEIGDNIVSAIREAKNDAKLLRDLQHLLGTLLERVEGKVTQKVEGSVTIKEGVTLKDKRKEDDPSK